MGAEYATVLAECEATLDQVDAALARLADGSYGLCATCGEPIPEERLAVAPAAVFCGRCDG